MKKNTGGEDPRMALQSFRAREPGIAVLYANVQALKILVEKADKEILLTLRIKEGSPNPFKPEDCTSGLVRLATSDQMNPFTGFVPPGAVGGLKFMLATAEQSPDYKAALEQYVPLLEAAEEADRIEETARLDRQKAEQKLRIAREQARARAASKIEDDEEVRSARVELESARKNCAEIGLKEPPAAPPVDPLEAELTAFEHELETAKYDKLNAGLYAVKGLVDKCRAAVASVGTHAIESEPVVLRAEKLFVSWAQKLKISTP